MGIPMTINLTKLGDSAASSQSMDSTLYRQPFGSWMHLVHTRPDTENAYGPGLLPAVDILIQIGMVVQLTRKVPLVIASIWDQQ